MFIHPKKRFTKGGWESDENEAETAALRETVEEAGVRGNVDGPVIGAFEFTSKKRSHIPDNKCLAYVFAMRVEEQLDEWPERLIRNRQWVVQRCFPMRRMEFLVQNWGSIQSLQVRMDA